jgi:hypothetical protein
MWIRCARQLEAEYSEVTYAADVKIDGRDYDSNVTRLPRITGNKYLNALACSREARGSGEVWVPWRQVTAFLNKHNVFA